MSKTVKRLLAVLAVLVVLAGGGALWLKSYVAPREALDLSYTSIDMNQKLLDMVQHMDPELILTEEDVNNLAKKTLAGGGFLDNPDIEVTGARFELNSDTLTAHINAVYKKRLPVGAVAVYRLSWQEPNIVMEPISVSVRGIELPAKLAGYHSIPVDLPIVKIKSVHFDRDHIAVSFGLDSLF